MSNSKPALVVIDLQNDYFPGGAFPLWQPEAVLEIPRAKEAQPDDNADLMAELEALEMEMKKLKG